MQRPYPTLFRLCLLPHPARPTELVAVGLCQKTKEQTPQHKDQVLELCQKRELFFLNENDSSGTWAERVERLVHAFSKRLQRTEDLQAVLSFMPELRDQQWNNVQPLLVSPGSRQNDLSFSQQVLLVPSLQLPQMPERKKEKMLLHVCCGPDAAGVVEQLKEDFELLCFWYDPNIQPQEEHDKRLQAFVDVCTIQKVRYIVGEYDALNFLSAIKNLEHSPEQGAKCSRCYDLRLERAAREAQVQNCDVYTTTLAISPHKVQKKLEGFGELHQKKYNIPYLAQNFMKANAFKKSVLFTQEHNIYRQDYCGCWYSLYEGGAAARAYAKTLNCLPKEKTFTAQEWRHKTTDPVHWKAYQAELSLNQNSNHKG